MFNFIKNSLKKIYSGITSRLSGLFTTRVVDTATLEELKIILLSADTGIQTTQKIMAALTAKHTSGQVQEGAALKHALSDELTALLEKPADCAYEGNVFLLVGINGSGKTTVAGKLAHHHASRGKKVLLVAADTFRAAASEQLASWAQTTGVDVVQGNQNQDPASVVFQGCEQFTEKQYDILIIDTAGRLHTKINLMHELAKIKRVITKQLAHEKITTLLTIDSMLGQNSFEQAKLFHEATDLSGIILTKMDGTGKGGIVFAITNELHVPIWYITFGEELNQLKLFDKHEYVHNLLNG